MIAGLFRYPVKSMRSEPLARARATDRGIEGDRRWALIDVETGHVVSAKYPRKWAGMLMLSARCAGEDGRRVVICLPGGHEIGSDDPECEQVLSAHLGRAVRLSDTPPSSGIIERTDPLIEGEIPAAGSAPLRTGQIGAGLAAPSFFDYAPIHLVTTATLRRLAELAPGSCFDAARFRPNLVLDLPDVEPFAENEWAGRRLQIGDGVVLRILLPSPRCAIPTLAQPGLPHDRRIIETIARHNRISIEGAGWGACVGAYVALEREGWIQTEMKACLALP